MLDDAATGRRWAAAIVGGLFLFAAFGKAWDASEGVRFLWVLSRDLVGVQPSPGALARVLLLVVMVEAGLGVWLMAAQPARALGWGIVAMLGVFTGLHLWALATGAPPCGCLGVRAQGGTEAALGVGRNVAAMYLLGWSVWPRTGTLRTIEMAGAREPATRPAHGGRAGFSVVEAMVTVVVVGVLVGILAPALQGARRESRVSESLAMSRQLVGAMSAYADDYGCYPFLATPGDPLEPLRVDGQVIPGAFLGGQSRRWATLCCPDYVEPREAIELPRARANDQAFGLPERLVRSHFFAAEGLFARPRYWEGEEEPAFAPEHFRGTRPADVLFPAQKGLIVDIRFGLGTDGPDEGEYLLTSFGDGSAGRLEAKLPSEAAVERGYGSLGWPVLSTRGGMHGRDR